MSIDKQILKNKPECKVKFTLSAEEARDAQKLAVVGDFNSWDPSADPMKKQKNGSFSVTINLPVGFRSKFRYLADGSRWINDSAADAYEYCPFAGEENSVLAL